MTRLADEVGVGKDSVRPTVREADARGIPTLKEPVFPDASMYDPRFTSEVVYQHLRELIILGFLSPGTEVKQSVLAKRLGVSRTPLREACRRLQAEGLVDLEVNRRAVVSEVSVTDVDEIYGSRIALESLGIRLTTGRLTEQELLAAESVLNEMWNAGLVMDLRAWTSAHLEFHMILVSHSGKHALQIMRRLASESDRYLFCYHSKRPFAPLTRHVEHEALLAAVSKKDPEVSGQLLARHLALTARDLIHDLHPDQATKGVEAALRLVDPNCTLEELDESLAPVP